MTTRGARYRSIGPVYLYTQAGPMGTMWGWDLRTHSWVNPGPYPYYASYWPQPNVSILGTKKECWDDVHSGPPYTTGGPLFIRHSELSVDRVSATLVSKFDCVSGNPIRKYEGGFCIPSTGGINANEIDARLERASTYGAQAWRMFTPDKPSADLGQFWYELRDLRSQFNPVNRSIKGLAGGYLNLEFGWKPFLNDIVKIINALNKIDAIVSRMVKHNGKWQKRKGVVTTNESGVTTQMGNLIHPILTGEFYTGSVASSGKMSVTESSKTWFEAKVKYYIPELDNPTKYNCAKLLAKILGLDFTKPLLYWKIFPYSWLIDWAGNMSHLIAGMETLLSTDLVCKYAYVMDERAKTVSLEQSQPFKCGGSVNLKTVYTLESKERANANPMGFGPLVLSLTPKQIAILAALGIQGNFGRI